MCVINKLMIKRREKKMPFLVGLGTGASVLVGGVMFSYLSGDWSICDFAWKVATVAAPTAAFSTAIKEYVR